MRIRSLFVAGLATVTAAYPVPCCPELPHAYSPCHHSPDNPGDTTPQPAPLVGFFVTLGDLLVQDTTAAVEDPWESAVEAVNDRYEQTVDTGKRLHVEAVEDPWENVVHATHDAAEGSCEEVIDAVQNATTTTRDRYVDAVHAVKNRYTDAAETVQNATTARRDRYVGAVIGPWEDVVDAVKNRYTDAVGAVENRYTDANRSTDAVDTARDIVTTTGDR